MCSERLSAWASYDARWLLELGAYLLLCHPICKATMFQMESKGCRIKASCQVEMSSSKLTVSSDLKIRSKSANTIALVMNDAKWGNDVLSWDPCNSTLLSPELHDMLCDCQCYVLYLPFQLSMCYDHCHQFNIWLTRRKVHATHCSSFPHAILIAFSSLDTPAVDFGLGSGSTSSGSDEMGVDWELEASEAGRGLPCILLSFHAWACWGVSAWEGGWGKPQLARWMQVMCGWLPSISMAPQSSLPRHKG